jgi:heme exporter protein A
MTTELEVVDVECIRGDRPLFSGFCLSLQAGQIQRIDGANGTGKTSLLRIICGLSLPESGEILWQGQPIGRQKTDYCRNLAYIGHTHGIKFELSPLENLRLHATLGVSQSRVSFEEALQRVGLYPFRNYPCRTLSAGQHRRVAVARLVLSKARLWVLDEPVTGIDQEGVQEIESLFESHTAHGGIIVFTSHQPLCLGLAAVRSLRIEP